MRGKPVADIIPYGRRTPLLDGDWLHRQLGSAAADRELAADLADLAGQTLADL